jgi:hypothetical protein
MRDQDSDQAVAERFDLTMRELLEEQESAPDEPRSVPSRERLLHAIDVEIDKLSDVLDFEEELRNRAALAAHLASYELEADFRDAAEFFKSQASAVSTEDPGARDSARYARLITLLRLRDSLGAASLHPT